jgi:hypothetical protein
LFCLLSLPLFAQDPASLDPRHVQILLENDRVRVLRLSLPPHEKIPPADFLPSVFVYFTNARLTKDEIPARAVRFLRPSRRPMENLGDATIEIVAVEFKNKVPQKSPGFPGDRDPAILDRTHFKLELQNEWCRVLDFHVGPLEAVPMHLNPDRIVIALTDANYRLTRPKYGTTVVEASAGEITWRPAELAALESTSNHLIDQILIAPRPFSLGPFTPKEPVKMPPKKR